MPRPAQTVVPPFEIQACVRRRRALDRPMRIRPDPTKVAPRTGSTGLIPVKGSVPVVVVPVGVPVPPGVPVPVPPGVPVPVEVPVPFGLGVLAAALAPPSVVTVVPDGVVHVGTVKVSLMSVTAPTLASARPFTVTALSNEIDWLAMIVPTKLVVVPRVADEPTCQKTLQACAPLIRLTVLLVAVVSWVPTWKTNRALGLPPPLSVSAPVSSEDDAEL